MRIAENASFTKRQQIKRYNRHPKKIYNLLKVIVQARIKSKNYSYCSTVLKSIIEDYNSQE